MARLACIVGFLVIVAGCLTLPPRHIEPELSDKNAAIISASKTGIGIVFVDRKIPCSEKDYNKKTLSKMATPTVVRVLPGPHEFVFGCWWEGGNTSILTNICVTAGERYNLSYQLVGYTLSISLEPESKSVSPSNNKEK